MKGWLINQGIATVCYQNISQIRFPFIINKYDRIFDAKLYLCDDFMGVSHQTSGGAAVFKWPTQYRPLAGLNQAGLAELRWLLCINFPMFSDTFDPI